MFQHIGRRYDFDLQSVAQTLRDLAGAIEDGRVLLESVAYANDDREPYQTRRLSIDVAPGAESLISYVNGLTKTKG